MKKEVNKGRRNLAIFLSVIIHGLLIYFIATAAIDLVIPKGVVMEIEFDKTELAKGIESGSIKPIPIPVAPKPKPKAKRPKVTKKKKIIVAKKPELPTKTAPPPKRKPVPGKIEVGDIPVKEKLDKIEDTSDTETDKLIDQTLEEEKIAANEPPEEEMETPEEEFEATEEEEADGEAVAAVPPGDYPPEKIPEEPVARKGVPDAPPAKTNLPPPAGMLDGVPVYTDRQLKPLKNPNWHQSRVSRYFKEEGQVVLIGRVGTDGKVQGLKLYKSSGFKRLDGLALEQGKELQFPPIDEPFYFVFGPNFTINASQKAETLKAREAERYKKLKKRR